LVPLSYQSGGTETTYKFHGQHKESTVNLPSSFPFFAPVVCPLIIFFSNAAKAHFSYFETKIFLMGFTERNVYTDSLCGSSPFLVFFFLSGFFSGH